MSETLPAAFDLAAEQPISTDIALYGGVFAKRHVIPKAGLYVPQHAHKFDHLSLLTVGGLRAWSNGDLLGDFIAPAEIRIPAHTKHTFLALADGTTFYCVHSVEHFQETEHGELPGVAPCASCQACEPPAPVMGEPDDTGMSFQQEPLAIAKRDADALMIEHALLIGEDPELRHAKNWPLMLKLDEMGVLHCTTARCNGKLFGYLLAIVAPSLEDEAKTEALHTSFCTSRDVPGLGLKLQRASIEFLRKRGVDLVELRAGTRGLGPRMGTIYRRLGAVAAGESYILKLKESA